MKSISKNSWQGGPAGADRRTRVMAIGSVRAANAWSDEATQLGPPAGCGPHDSLVRASFRLDTERRLPFCRRSSDLVRCPRSVQAPPPSEGVTSAAMRPGLLVGGPDQRWVTFQGLP